MRRLSSERHSLSLVTCSGSIFDAFDAPGHAVPTSASSLALQNPFVKPFGDRDAVNLDGPPIHPPFCKVSNFVAARRRTADLFACTLHAARLYLRDHRSWSLVARNSLTRRFLVGARLGDLVNAYLQGDTRSHRPSWGLRAGQFFGLWAVTVLALDAVLDAEACNRAAAVKLTEHVADLLTETTLWGQDSAHRVLADVGIAFGATALRLCGALRRDIDALSREIARVPGHRWAARAHFSTLARELLQGAARSLEQFTINRQNDWAWYCREVLDQKTLNFFLAPCALLCATPEEAQRYDLLRTIFTTLNSGYSHWQLLDDIADLREDTRASMITAPGYILVSQGNLAEQVLLKPSDPTGAIWIRNSLLMSPLCAGPSWRDSADLSTHALDGSSVSGREDLVRRALANTIGDFSVPLPTLCTTRLQQITAFIEALSRGETARALSAIYESGVTVRLLSAVYDRERLARVVSVIAAVDDGALMSVIHALDTLMSHAFSKARLSVESTHN
jgi:hypothetical protein